MSDERAISRLLRYATDLFEHQELRAALDVLRQREALLADSGLAWQLRGLLHTHLGEFAEAVDALEHASLLIPLAPVAQCRLAEGYLRSRRRDVAHAIYVHLASLELLDEELAAPIARGLATTDEAALALSFCQVHLRQVPGNHELHFVAATVMQRMGCHAEEIHSHAFQAHHLRPDILPYRILYAQQLAATGECADASAMLQAVDLDQVRCIASLERLRLLFCQLGQSESAECCQARLEQIAYERSSMWRPPSNEA